MTDLACINTRETPARAPECEPQTDATHRHPSWMASNVKFGSQWVKILEFLGVPSRGCFKMEALVIPKLEKREILVEVLCWSVENYMRDFETKLETTMTGETVARVVASRHINFSPGTLVTCAAGWRTHWVCNPDVTHVRSLMSSHDLQASFWLGPLGLPGLLAYFSVLGICPPKAGDIVLVNAGAGSVGSVVGQLAKIRGCIVIGYAASRARCDWMRELGFNYVYSGSVTVSAALRRQAPSGLDFCFDCVGAEFIKEVVQHMKPDGTICVFGYNSGYARRVGWDEARLSDPYTMLYMNNGTVKSCSLFDFQDKFDTAQAELVEWMTQGKLRTKQTMLEGFRSLPDALNTLYDETSVGTVYVKNESFDNACTPRSKGVSFSSLATHV